MPSEYAYTGRSAQRKHIASASSKQRNAISQEQSIAYHGKHFRRPARCICFPERRWWTYCLNTTEISQAGVHQVALWDLERGEPKQQRAGGGGGGRHHVSFIGSAQRVTLFMTLSLLLGV